MLGSSVPDAVCLAALKNRVFFCLVRRSASAMDVRLYHVATVLELECYRPASRAMLSAL